MNSGTIDATGDIGKLIMSSTAWENFINSSVQNKKDYYSDYAPPTGTNASQKGLLGSPGAHFVDLTSLNFSTRNPLFMKGLDFSLTTGVQ